MKKATETSNTKKTKSSHILLYNCFLELTIRSITDFRFPNLNV